MSCLRPLSESVSPASGSDLADAEGANGYGTRGAAKRQSKRHEKELALRRTIEAEIIPRLMLAHRSRPMRFKSLRPLVPSLDAEDVEEFTRLVVSRSEPSVAAEYIEALRRQDVTLETVFLDLIAPCARLLGELWVEDLCDFTDVTIGLGQLRQLLHQFNPAFQEEAERQAIGLAALLAPTPGDQHSLGIGMVEKFFVRAGWTVDAYVAIEAGKLKSLVRKRHFDVVGLSLSCEVLLSELTSTITVIREVSKNREVCVLVGGPLFLSQPELVGQVGADATAIDGREAVRHVVTVRGATGLRAAD